MKHIPTDRNGDGKDDVVLSHVSDVLRKPATIMILMDTWKLAANTTERER
jgi:hypothetical protein